MEVEGGCYCRAVRYKATGTPGMKVQCHCRECQYISGGSPNVVMGMPDAGFVYSQGTAKAFQRQDLESPVTREFCGECGTHLLSRVPTMPDAVLIKVGTLDDPSVFDAPQAAIYLSDGQSFHTVPAGCASFDRLPG